MGFMEQYELILNEYGVEETDKVNLYDIILDYKDKHDDFDIETFISEIDSNDAIKQQFRENYFKNYGNFKYTDYHVNLF